jgi:hypothetical protein
MNYESFLWECKRDAEGGKSKIPTDSKILTDVTGMSTPNVRHYMNNINKWGKNYLEVGSYKGSTFVSSLHKHDKRGWSIDNFSEFCDDYNHTGSDGTHKEELLGNIEKYVSSPTQFYQEDSFEFDIDQIDEPVDVFMYDGNHDQDKQRKALEYYYPVLNDICLFVVDDWNSQAVRDGTYQGIHDMGMCILGEMTVRTHGQGDWWSGMFSAFLAKECPEGYFLQRSISSGGCNYAHPIVNSRPRDVVLRLNQPENDKSIDEIRKILKDNFTNLSEGELEREIGEGLNLLEQQSERGVF